MSLEELFEKIGKRMSLVSMIYPNAGKWTVHLFGSEDTYEGKTVYEALEKFYKDNK